MNREQKISLIIGFAVILVVGVLVSDHLSRARQLQLADATEGDATRYEQLPVVVLNDPAASRAVPTEVAGTAPTVEPAGPLARSQPAEITPSLESGRPYDVGQPLDVTVIAQSPDLQSDSPLGRVLQRTGLDATPAETRVHLFPDGMRPVVGLAQRDGARAGESDERAARATATPVESDRRAAPEPIRHRVVPNESLFEIAKKYYGNGSKWRRIAEANPDLVGAEGRIRSGDTLLIPGTEASPAPREDRTEAPKTDSRAAPAQVTTYTVKKNDTLGEIAQRLLGSSRRMDEIVRANRAKIDDPDDIYSGMVLNIPPR